MNDFIYGRLFYMLRFAALTLVCAFASPAQTSVCAVCHPAIAQSYSRTGMAQSFYRPKAESTVEDYDHKASDIHYAMVQRGGRYFQTQSQIGFDGKQASVQEVEVDFVLGSGTHVRSYLHRTAKDTLVLLPLAWYAEKGGYWAMNPGFDRPDHQGLRRTVTYECMFCHNAYPEIPATHVAPVFSRVPEGIDCQRCHGDGRHHVDLARRSAKLQDIRSAIVNPSRLTPDRQMEVCMQCHLETTSSELPASIVRYERGPFSYKPGEPLSDFMLHFDHARGKGHDDKFEITGSVYRLRKSQCFLKSNGALQCTTCHDPHSTPSAEDAGRHYAEACRLCHAQPLDRLIFTNRHTASLDCIGCHMPKRRTDDVVHAVMTDHYIQRTKPAADLLLEQPEQLQPPYRGEVVLYYPRAPPKPEDELYMAIAQVTRNTNLGPGIARLSAAIAKFRPARPEYYLQLGDAWCNAGKCEAALPAYEEALRRDPLSEPPLLKLAMCLTTLRQYARADATLQRALKIAPDDAAAWVQLGLTQLGLTHSPEAVKAFEQATHADPEMVEPYNLLGAMLFENGDAARAEAVLRNAVRMQPNFAQARNNLGNLLSETGRFEEARFHFEAALRYRENYLGARYNYALALNRAHRLDEAQTQLEAILRINPNSAEAHEFLGNLFSARNQFDRAIEQYRQAIRIEPAFDRANLDLGSALANTSDPGAALPYLRKAAQSPDAATRDAAQKILQKLGKQR
jgi:tetratricopeptide (TPR) repeat protein